MGTQKKIPIREVYSRLYNAFGPQHWWPGDTPFEIIVGAILTQNTNWSNVEQAVRRLKQHDCLSPKAMQAASTRRIAAYIKPAGYFNVKAKRLKNFLAFLFQEYGGSLKRMGEEPTELLRQKLLTVNGIGPETADSILLYAFQKPSFVVDAYTKRILVRHNMVDNDADYHHIKSLFESQIKPDQKKYNEYHALIVELGKSHCRPKARCEACPLNDMHYSLKYKCCRCHRALPKTKERKYKPDGLFCIDCALH